MELLEQIRNLVIENNIKPARSRGEKSLIVVSGEIHSRMGLTNRIPAVCNALRSERPWNPSNVRLVCEIRLPSVQKDSSTNKFKLAIE